MSYLKTFQKFAERPLRPRIEEEEPQEAIGIQPGITSDADEGLTLDDAVKGAFPKAAEPLDLSDPYDNFDQSNMFQETFGSADVRKQLALEVASNAGSEVLKGFDETLRRSVDPSQDVLRYVKEDGDVREEVATLLSASPIQETSPAAERAAAEGRVLRKVRTLDDVITDAVGQRLEKAFIDKAGTKPEGREAYESFVSSFAEGNADQLRKSLGVEGPIKFRDAERFVAQYVNRELEAPGSQAAKLPLNLIAIRSAEAAQELAQSNLLRRAVGAKTPGLTISPAKVIDALRGVEDDDIRGKIYTGSVLGLVPGFLPASGAARQVLLDAKARLDDVKSDLEKGAEADYLGKPADGGRAFFGSRLGVNILEEALAQRTPDISFDFTPQFALFAPPTREQVTAQYASAVVPDEQEQRRLLYLGQRIGIPIDMAYAIQTAESNKEPTAFAYNLHIDNENRTPEQNAQVLSALQAIGLDPETKKRNKPKEKATSYYGDDARKAFLAVYNFAPASAVRGAAWGQYQVLGARGSGDFIKLMQERVKAEQGKDISEDEAAAYAVAAFRDSPRAVSDELFARWFSRNPEALKAAKERDIPSLVLRYYGYSEEKDTEADRASRRRWVAAATDAQKAYVEQMTSAPELVAEQAERNKATTSESYAPGDVPADAEKRDFVHIDGAGPVLTQTLPAVGPSDPLDEEVNIELIESAGGLVEQMTAFAQTPQYPTYGGTSWVLATAPFRDETKQDAEVMSRMDVAKTLPISESFGYFAELYVTRELDKLQRDSAREGREPEQAEVKAAVDRGKRKAFRAASSAQTAQYWTQPFMVSAEFIDAIDSGAPLPDDTQTSLADAALTPQVEVLGRSDRNGIVFRQETGTLVLLNAFDALPIYGMSFNIGFVGTPMKRVAQDVMNDRLSTETFFAAIGLSPDEYAQYVNDSSVVSKVTVGKILREMWANGVRGVESRANLVETGAWLLGEGAARAARTDLGQVVGQSALAVGLAPAQIAALAPELQRVALADTARAAGQTLGMVPGFIVAMKSPDVLTAVSDSVRVSAQVSRAFRGLKDADQVRFFEPMGLLSRAREVYDIGLKKQTNVELIRGALTTLHDVELKGDIDVDAVNAIMANIESTLASMREADGLDGKFRGGYLATASKIDSEVELELGRRADANPDGPFNGAANARDIELSNKAFELLNALSEMHLDDPVKGAAAQRLRELLTSVDPAFVGGKPGVAKTIGLSPGQTDAVLGRDGAETAEVVFDSASKIEALLLGMKLAEPQTDATGFRRRVFDGAMISRLERLGSEATANLDEGFDANEGLLGALEFFGPASDEVFTAALRQRFKTKRPKDEAKITAKRDKLVAFHEKLMAAIGDGSIIDPDMTEALRDEFYKQDLAHTPGAAFSSRQTKYGSRATRYRNAVAQVLNTAESTLSASTDSQLLQRVLAGVIEVADVRGEFYKQVAAFPFDAAKLPETMGATEAERLTSLLSPDGGFHVLDRLRAARRAASQEIGALATAFDVRGLGLRGAKRLEESLRARGLDDAQIRRIMAYRSDRVAVLQAKRAQDLADGNDPYSFARTLQRMLVSGLEARIKELPEGSEAAVQYAADLERVRSDDWFNSTRKTLNDMAEETQAARREGRAPRQMQLDLPIAVDPVALGMPARKLKPLAATRAFYEKYAAAYSFAPAQSGAQGVLSTRRSPKRGRLSKEEREAELLLLDQMLRSMAGVSNELDDIAADAAVKAFVESTFLNVRAVRGAKERAERYDEVQEQLAEVISQTLRLDSPNKETWARLLDDNPRRADENFVLEDVVLAVNRIPSPRKQELLHEFNVAAARGIDVVLSVMDEDEALVLFGRTQREFREAVESGETDFVARRLYEEEVQPALAPEFYSRLRQFIEQSPQKVYTPERLRIRLRKAAGAGVKKDEIDSVRLEEFLSGKTKVTKDELLEWLDDNAVQLTIAEKVSTPQERYSADDFADAVGMSSRFTGGDPTRRNEVVGYFDRLRKESLDKYRAVAGDLGYLYYKVADEVGLVNPHLATMRDFAFAIKNNPSLISDAVHYDEAAFREALPYLMRVPPTVQIEKLYSALSFFALGFEKEFFGDAAYSRFIAPGEPLAYRQFLATIPSRETPESDYDVGVGFEFLSRLGVEPDPVEASEEALRAYEMDVDRTGREFLRGVSGNDDYALPDAQALVESALKSASRVEVAQMNGYKSYMGRQDRPDGPLTPIGFSASFFDPSGRPTRFMFFDTNKGLVTDSGVPGFEYPPGYAEMTAAERAKFDPDGRYSEYINSEVARLGEVADKGEDLLAERAGLAASSRKDYYGEHFDEPNIVAHMRTTDRLTSDGKRILFIEEIQSDWHQAALEADYSGPRGPFASSWADLMLKKALRVAAEGQYDGIALTRGELIHDIVGGKLSGQKKYYDEVYPNKLKKLVAQDGGSFSVRDDIVTDKAGQPVATLTLTLPEKTRERVLRQGQMLFQKEEVAPAAAKAPEAPEPFVPQAPEPPAMFAVEGTKRNAEVAEKALKDALDSLGEGVDRRLTPGLGVFPGKGGGNSEGSSVEITVPLKTPVEIFKAEVDKVTFVVPFKSRAAGRMAADLFGFSDEAQGKPFERRQTPAGSVAVFYEKEIPSLRELRTRNRALAEEDGEDSMVVPLDYMPDINGGGIDRLMDVVLPASAPSAKRDLYRASLPDIISEQVQAQTEGASLKIDALQRAFEETPTGRAIAQRLEGPKTPEVEAPEAEAPEVEAASAFVEAPRAVGKKDVNQTGLKAFDRFAKDKRIARISFLSDGTRRVSVQLAEGLTINGKNVIQVDKAPSSTQAKKIERLLEPLNAKAKAPKAEEKAPEASPQPELMSRSSVWGTYAGRKRLTKKALTAFVDDVADAQAQGRQSDAFADLRTQKFFEKHRDAVEAEFARRREAEEAAKAEAPEVEPTPEPAVEVKAEPAPVAAADEAADAGDALPLEEMEVEEVLAEIEASAEAKVADEAVKPAVDPDAYVKGLPDRGLNLFETLEAAAETESDATKIAATAAKALPDAPENVLEFFASAVVKKQKLKRAAKLSDQIKAEQQRKRAAINMKKQARRAAEAEKRAANNLAKLRAADEAGERISFTNARKLLAADPTAKGPSSVPEPMQRILQELAMTLPTVAAVPKNMKKPALREVGAVLIAAWRQIRQYAPDEELDAEFLAFKRALPEKMRELRDTLLDRLSMLDGVDQEVVAEHNVARTASLVARAAANNQLAETPVAVKAQSQALDHASNLREGGAVERSRELRDNLFDSTQPFSSLDSESLIRIYGALEALRLPRKTASQQERGEFGERLLDTIDGVPDSAFPLTMAELLSNVRTVYKQFRDNPKLDYSAPAFNVRLPESEQPLKTLAGRLLEAFEDALNKRDDVRFDAAEEEFMLAARAAPEPEVAVTPEPAVVEPAVVEPAVAEPAAVEPAAVEPAAAAVEPAAVEPADVEPAAVEPAAAEPVVDATAVEPAAAAEPVAAVEPAPVTAVEPPPEVEAPAAAAPSAALAEADAVAAVAAETPAAAKPKPKPAAKPKRAKPQPLTEAEIEELVQRLDASPEEDRALAALIEYYESLPPQALVRRAQKYGIDAGVTPLEVAYEDWYQLRRNNLIRSEKPGVKPVTVPQKAEEVTPQLLRMLTRFQSQSKRAALERAANMEDLIRGAENVETMTDSQIVDYVFSNLNIQQRDELLSESDAKAFADFVRKTVENRFGEVDSEVASLRDKAEAARKLAERLAEATDDEAKQLRAKRLSDAADMYDRRADRFERANTSAREQGLDRMTDELGNLRAAPTDEAAVNIKGMTYFIGDTSAILYALKSADARTGVHEVAHVMRRVLSDADQRVVQEWVNSRISKMKGSNDQSLTPVSIDSRKQMRGAPESVVAGEELFAEAFDQYLREGVVPNQRMGTVFATIKALFRKIVGMLTRAPARVDISPAMYQLFDEAFGGVATLTADNIANVSDAIMTNRTLGEVTEGAEIPLMRITAQGVQEETTIGKYRQLTASLADYRSRGFLPRIFEALTPESLIERAPGPGQSPTARAAGPVTRRFRSLESRQTPDVVRDRMFSVMDSAAVTVATGFELVSLLLIGADSVGALRNLQPAARTLLRGTSRDLEESANTYATVMNDITRRVSSVSKGKALSDLAAAFEGTPVQLRTGAQRGLTLPGTQINAAEGVFASLRRYFNVLDKNSQEALAGAAENELLRMTGVPLPKVSGADTALMGLWNGLQRRPMEFKDGDAYSAGLHVNPELLLMDTPEMKRAGQGARVESIEQTTQEMLQDILRALSGTVGETHSLSDTPDARRLAAVLLFYSGVVDLRLADRVSADDLVEATGKSKMLLLLEGVSGVSVGDMTVKRVPGFFRGFNFAPERRSTAVLAMGTYGALSKVLEDTFDMGVGLNSGDYNAYFKYVSNLGARMSEAEIARAQRVERVYGYDVAFQALDTRLGRMYVPRAVRAEMVDATLGRAKRQLGLTETDNVTSKDTWVSALAQHVMVNTVFGNGVVRMTYLLPATLDIFRGVSAEAGFVAGLSATMRTAPQLVLNIPLAGPATIARGAEVAELAGGGWLSRNLKNLRRPSAEGDAAVESFKNDLRAAAGRLGDRWGRAVTEFFSLAKFKVEVAPIMEGDPNVVFNIGDTLYRASDLRRVFAREGMYSNPFKMIAAENRRASRDFLTGKLSSSDVSPKNEQLAEDAVDLFDNFANSHQGAAARGTRSAYSFAMEHGVEAADSFSDFERTGVAVALMEQGISPEYAARLTVRALYDYRGSMTSVDRGFFTRMLLPFFAFAKNATEHTINLLTTPRGIYMMRALERLPRMTADVATTIIYEAAVGPYGVDVSGMNPYQRDMYYTMRNYFEFGLGENASDEDLDALREQLPDDLKDMSREDLLRYSFNGWTALNGYDGYDNVPDDVRAAVRGLIANTSVVRASGTMYRVNQTLFDPEARAQFATLGSVAVRPEPSKAGLPGFAAQRYPTVQLFTPNMTPSVQEAVARGMQQSIYLSFPDSMMYAGFERITASMATGFLLFKGAGRAGTGESSEADLDAILNSLEPLMDLRGLGAPTTKAVYDIATNLTGAEQAYLELHPYMARRFEGTFGTSPSFEGAPDNAGVNLRGLSATTRLMLSRLESVPLPAEVAGRALDVEVEKRFKAARMGRVVVRDGRREIEYYDRFGEYVAGDGESIYKPFLVGMPAIIARRTFFGELNRLLLAADAALSPEELAKIDSEIQNLLMSFAVDAARASGVRVYPYDEERNARSVEAAIPR